MVKTVLVTRPCHDYPTSYLYAWSSLAIKQFKNVGLKVIDLAKKKANPKNFNRAIRKNPNLVFFNGHGSKEVITGHDNQILISAGVNESCLSGKIVYAVACQAAAVLGKKCVQAKTKAFIGYKENFYLCTSQSKEKPLLKDKLAALFLDPSNTIPLAIAQGNTASTSYHKSQNEMYNNLNYLLSTKALKTERDAAPYLWSNIRCQSLLGDKQAII